MTIISLLITLSAAAMLDGTLTAHCAFGAVMPDAFVVATLVWLWMHRGTCALAGALAIGLTCDLSVASRMGTVTLIFAAAGVIWAWLDDLRPSTRYLLLAVIAMGLPLAMGSAFKLTGNATLAWPSLCWRALAVGCYSLAISLLLALAINWCREVISGSEVAARHINDGGRVTF